MGLSSQIKGANGERELVSLLKSHGYNVERGGSLTYGTKPDIEGLPGIHIECKRVEKLDISKAMEQAQRDSLKFKDGAPTVFHRKNYGDWLVTMRFEDWIELYKNKKTCSRCKH